MATQLSSPNQQGLDIQSTPREEMDLYPLDTFAYEFPGRDKRIDFLPGKSKPRGYRVKRQPKRILFDGVETDVI